MSIFISIEGGDGAGKTTQISMLREMYHAKGVKTIITREPGGTMLAEKIRELFLGGGEIDNPMIEFLLLTAARLDHVNNVIKPALADNTLVISDRFIHSTIVYQCLVKGLDIAVYDSITKLTLGDFRPDLTFYLDIDSMAARGRLRARGEHNHYDEKNIDFRNQVRAGFLSFTDDPRFVVIDASGSAEEVHRRICNRLDATNQGEYTQRVRENE